LQQCHNNIEILAAAILYPVASSTLLTAWEMQFNSEAVTHASLEVVRDRLAHLSICMAEEMKAIDEL
jgi:hypothetical protein